MPPKAPKAAVDPHDQSRKRKEAPQYGNGLRQNQQERGPKRVKVQNARTILTQTSDAALTNGELDLQAFLKAREFEIKALEDGMRRSKGALATRAFQQVPRNLRRRTASHNVKRVPTRLQKRAAREKKEDNTPTVSANKRKPVTSRGRIRSAKRLGLLSKKKKKTAKGQDTAAAGANLNDLGVIGRAPKPKLKIDVLTKPPKPVSKFRKRQIHKTWLPTHIYHAKRARMTEAKNPLWRLAIPLTPTEKSYRPTHRAGNARGAVGWDMSYMSTIGLEGTETSLEKVLRAIGITQIVTWGKSGQKWRSGKRIWNGWLSRNGSGHDRPIGPATVIWSPALPSQADVVEGSKNIFKVKKSVHRRLFIRVHPAAFLELWNDVLRVSKMQRPLVTVEDLRFEIGSIELTGPDSTEALLGVLYPYDKSTDTGDDSHVKTFKALTGVTNAASVPPNALLTFSILDPRLRYPPQKLELPKPKDEEVAFSLLELLASWPADLSLASSALFDRDSRVKATHLVSQKSINRRKGAAPPGEYPSPIAMDQSIPVLLFTSRVGTSSSGQGSWTLLAPWKCILPIWYCLMHFPLSSGGNPRFGGLQELQQMHFEHGQPWFPADFPGTEAGWSWEIGERQRRKQEWDRRPKGKRIEFESLDLGGGRKGEIGKGWACDFETLKNPDSILDSTDKRSQNVISTAGKELHDTERAGIKPAPTPFQHLSSTMFLSLLSNPKLDLPKKSLAIIRITLLSRGVPLACARIYRLPTVFSHQDHSTPNPELSAHGPTPTKPKHTSATPSLRNQWLALNPSANPTKGVPSKASRNPSKQPPVRISSLPSPLRQRALAQQLLQTPPLSYPATADQSRSHDTYPIVPGEEDLIGFVTTGNFNLAEGKGTAIGNVDVQRVITGLRTLGKGEASGVRREGRMCIVRNAGETVGRLAVWEVV